MLPFRISPVRCIFRLRPVVFGILALVIGAGVGVVLACGPRFETRSLLTDADLFRKPIGVFPRELKRLTPDPPGGIQSIPPAQRSSSYQQTADADLAELTEALMAAGVAANERDQLLHTYALWRNQLARLNHRRADHQESGGGDEHRPAWTDPAEALDWQRLPLEFSLYLQGAVARARDDNVQARVLWRRLLDLPPEQRHYRTTWAAYMIGRSYIDDDPSQAAPWFAQTRQLAAEGFADSIGLAAASLGWEARAALDLQQFDRAVTLYLAQLATGEESANASLQICARRLLRSERHIQLEAARQPAVQRLVTAYLIADVHHDRIPFAQHPGVETWLDILTEALPIPADDDAPAINAIGADRLAWLAYQAGDMATTARWLALADPREPMTLWLSSRLALRDGDLDHAMQLLAEASRAFPPELQHRPRARNSTSPSGDRVRGELAALHLAREQYTQALDHLLRSGYWMDAAYIAERVLTVDELIAYVDEHWPRLPSLNADDEHRHVHFTLRYHERERTSDLIRSLLARRLTRDGRWREAHPYFSDRMQRVLDAYIAGIRRGHRRDLTPAERADAFWQAARIARHRGLELLATELAPDWSIYGANWNFGNAADAGRPAEGIVAMSRDEARRLAASMPEIDRRWHYRYVAADHAWQALALMPDNEVETARRFIIAGRWLAPHDPQAADRFYKALVRRCLQIDLGREADERRWFPPITEPAYHTPTDTDTTQP